jgi:hypothetical protein
MNVTKTMLTNVLMMIASAALTGRTKSHSSRILSWRQLRIEIIRRIAGASRFDVQARLKSGARGANFI